MSDNNQNAGFLIGLTVDFYKEGKPVYPDFDLSQLEREPGIELTTFEEHRDEIAPEQLVGLNGVVVLSPPVTQHNLATAISARRWRNAPIFS